MLVQGASRSGVWADKNFLEAARIASQYWNQAVELVEYALTTPENRIVYDRFIPKQKEMQHMADLMVRFNLITTNDISGLIEDRFAVRSDLSDITDIDTIIRPTRTITASQGHMTPAAAQSR